MLLFIFRSNKHSILLCQCCKSFTYSNDSFSVLRNLKLELELARTAGAYFKHVIVLEALSHKPDSEVQVCLMPMPKGLPSSTSHSRSLFFAADFAVMHTFNPGMGNSPQSNGSENSSQRTDELEGAPEVLEVKPGTPAEAGGDSAKAGQKHTIVNIVFSRENTPTSNKSFECDAIISELEEDKYRDSDSKPSSEGSSSISSDRGLNSTTTKGLIKEDENAEDVDSKPQSPGDPIPSSQGRGLNSTTAKGLSKEDENAEDVDSKPQSPGDPVPSSSVNNFKLTSEMVGKMDHISFIWPTSCSALKNMTTDTSINLDPDDELQELLSNFTKHVRPAYQG